MKRNKIKNNKVNCGLFVCMILFMSSLLSGCNNNKNDVVELEIATDFNNAEYFNRIIAEYNKSNLNYNINLSIYNSLDEIKYKINKKLINPDFIVFNNVNDANFSFEGILTPLNTYEFVGDYQAHTINYLKQENNLYVIPGPGNLYTECYNTDLLAEKNISLPTTIDDLKTTNARMKNAGLIPNVSEGEKEFILASLLEVAVPNFFSTPKTIDFLNKYYLGETTISDNSEMFNAMDEMFKKYLSLFRIGFYDINDYQNQTIETAINQFYINQNTCSIINTPSLVLRNEYNLESPFEYSLYPFVGNNVNDTYVASTPTFYLGATKSGIDDLNRKKGIINFFNEISTNDGQNLLRDYNFNSNKGLISYLKDFNFEIDERTGYLEDTLLHGRNYLVDTFMSIFGNTVDEIYDFLYANILGNGQSFNTLANKIDQKNQQTIDQKNKKYEVLADYNFDGNYLKENDLFDFTADALRNITGTNVVLISSSFINENIYKGSLYDYELNVVFNNINGYIVKMSGSGIKKIINDNLYLENKKNPLISGIRLSKENNIIDIKSLDKKPIEDRKNYNVFISEDYYESYMSYIISSNSPVNMLSYIRKYLNSNNFSNSGIDGRYKNIY